MNNELECMRKEEAVSLFKILFACLPGATEKNQRNLLQLNSRTPDQIGTQDLWNTKECLPPGCVVSCVRQVHVSVFTLLGISER
jgi:hypothetical protein